jgi:hypothetical protein
MGKMNRIGDQMFLIDSIFLAPLKGVVWLGKKISEVAENQLHDEDHLKEELMALQLQFELDQISEQELDKKEKELLARLDDIMDAKNKEA